MNTCLEAVGLEKTYRKKKVVDDVTIRVEKGEIVGLLGPNGAGKTTTFAIILGLISGDAGKIIMDGQDITRLPMYVRARLGVCLLPQEPSSFRKLSVWDNLAAIDEMLHPPAEKNPGRLFDLLVEFGLGHLLDAKAFSLSGGERRRLEIARALLTQPEYILLDEPFTGIDPLAISDLQQIIMKLKTRGLGLLITDHSVRETLEITDRAYIIDNGKILKQGLPSELVESIEVKRSYLGEEFRLDN